MKKSSWQRASEKREQERHDAFLRITRSLERAAAAMELAARNEATLTRALALVLNKFAPIVLRSMKSETTKRRK